MRSALFVVSLALGRLRRRGSGALAAALGVAAAAAVLAAILVGVTVARDRSVAQAIDRLPDASRSVRAVWFGVPAGPEESWAGLDRRARTALGRIGLSEPVPIALVRESTVGDRFVGLAAVDGLESHVLLHSGRLPRACSPARCEVLRLRGTGRLPDVPGLRVAVVGTATLRSRQLFGDFLAPTDNALADAQLAPALAAAARYHRPAPAPLVVAEGVRGLVSSPVLDRTYRSYAWVQALGSGAPRAWEVGETLANVDRARSELVASSSSWAVEAPTSELEAADRAATVAGRRLLLVGGEVAALLVAFAILAAGAMRRDLDAARRRLTWQGARRWQLGLLVGTESAVVGAGGALAGWVVGVTAGAAGAALAGAPAGAVVAAAALTPAAVGLAVAVALVAATVIAAAVSWRPRVGRLGALDVAAMTALLVVAVLLAGGTVDAGRLERGGGPALTLILLPGLVAFAGAVAAARLAPTAGRALARARVGPASRLAGVSVARGVGSAGIAVAFLTLAIGLALLAESYRATLARGERDQAAFEVPADLVVREDLRALVPVLDAAPLTRYAALARGGAAHPVARLSASAGRAGGISGVTVLGLPAGAAADLPLWRDAWGATRAKLAALSDGSATLAGARLPDGPLRVSIGPSLLRLRAVVRGRDGSFTRIDLGGNDTRKRVALGASLPERARRGMLVALEFLPPRLQERGADAGTALRGRLELGLVGGSLAGWLGEGGVTATPARDPRRLVVDYVVTPQHTARLRAPQPTDATPPEVAVTPALAALAGGVGGTLPLRIAGAGVNVKVASVVQRFPGTRGDVVVAGLDELTTAVDAVTPGGAPVGELWLDLPPGRVATVAGALERPPFRALDVVSRAAVEADARRDPLGHGTLIALLAAALVALGLAVAGLVLSVRADLRDERGELVDLEAQGASPRLLRRLVRTRTLLVASLGLAGGAVVGALLAPLVTRLVRVTARAGAAEPPLVTTIDPLVVVGAAAVVGALALALVGWATRSAFSDPRGPGRIGGDP